MEKVLAAVALSTLLGAGALIKYLFYPNRTFDGIPRIEVGGRVTDLFNGEHFDDLLQDTPDDLRPPTLLAFYDSKDAGCMSRFDALGYKYSAETVLPARERVMIAKYDMGFDKERLWYQWTHEKDLPKRFGVPRNTAASCPTLMYIPRKCNGWTTWCQDPVTGDFGCENYKEQCTGQVKWQGESKDGPWEQWAQKLIDKDGEPYVARPLGSYSKQGQWLLQREACTTNNHQRNMYIFSEIPQYTTTGYETHQIPDSLYDELMAYYHRWEAQKYTEEWDTWGSTQINFHEAPTTMVSLDFDVAFRQRIADYIQPLLSKWSNQSLRFSSFYGIRAYPEGAFLHPHLDRIDTHVISATFSLAKLNVVNESDPSLEWPLRVVEPHTGLHKNYVHPPRTLVFYESSKVIHGRPTKNPVGGGIHLGCFIHYAVVGGDYDTLKEKAKQKLQAFELRMPFRSTASVEPKQVKWFDMGTSNLNTFRKNSKRATTSRLNVVFENDLDFPVHLSWVGPTGLVSQGMIDAGATLDEQTEEGHRFVWSLKERSKTAEPEPGAAIEVMSRGATRFRASKHKHRLLHDAAHDL